MNSLLDNQQVRKRYSRSSGKIPARKRSGGANSGTAHSVNSPDFRQEPSPGKSGRKTAYRPAGITALFKRNSRIIDGIKQNPARIQRRKSTGAAGGREWNTQRKPAFSFPKPGNITRLFSAGEETGTGEYLPKRRSPSFALPAIPVIVLFTLVLGIFLVIHAQRGSLDWMNRQVVNNSGNDEAGQSNLALYAGITPEEKPAVQGVPTHGDTIPLDLTESFAWQTYKVKKGDSVSKIAAAFSVSMDAIIASNGITNAHSLRVGEDLRIPNMDGIPYTVKSGDNLSGISKAMGVPIEAILDANEIQNDRINAGMSLFIPGARMKRDDLKMALGELFIYPLRSSRLSSSFGWRNDPFTGVRTYHAAVDLAAPLGTPVKAAMDGKVSALGYNTTFGNYIILSHSGGLQTMYAHLNAATVKRGDQVNQGVQIGNVGTTGYSTGPHLHFAVYKNGRAVNPLDFLNSKN